MYKIRFLWSQSGVLFVFFKVKNKCCCLWQEMTPLRGSHNFLLECCNHAALLWPQRRSAWSTAASPNRSSAPCRSVWAAACLCWHLLIKRGGRCCYAKRASLFTGLKSRPVSYKRRPRPSRQAQDRTITQYILFYCSHFVLHCRVPGPIFQVQSFIPVGIPSLQS